ncbi:hypothetical protein ACSBR2_018009 [Camellia fascicularis]
MHLIVDSPARLQSTKSLLLRHRSRLCRFFKQASVALREVLGPPLLVRLSSNNPEIRSSLAHDEETSGTSNSSGDAVRCFEGISG